MVLVQPLGHLLERDQPGSRQDARLTHPAADDLPRAPRLVDERP